MPTEIDHQVCRRGHPVEFLQDQAEDQASLAEEALGNQVMEESKMAAVEEMALWKTGDEWERQSLAGATGEPKENWATEPAVAAETCRSRRQAIDQVQQVAASVNRKRRSSSVDEVDRPQRGCGQTETEVKKMAIGVVQCDARKPLSVVAVVGNEIMKAMTETENRK